MNARSTSPSSALLNQQKAAVGIHSLGPAVVIHRGHAGRNGAVETSLELEFEIFEGHAMARLRTVYRQGMSFKSNGCTWTVANPDQPVELISILDRILQAARPGAPVIDMRGWFGRLMDVLVRRRHVNDVPSIAKQSAPFPQTLSADIKETNSGIWVTLIYDPGKGRPKRYQSLSITALEALHVHLSKVLGRV